MPRSTVGMPIMLICLYKSRGYEHRLLNMVNKCRRYRLNMSSRDESEDALVPFNRVG